MKSLLVTGGCGFIGSHFIRRYLANHPDCRLQNLDKLTYSGNLQNTQDFKDHKNYQFAEGDVCDSKKVESVVSKADAIVHFAAETHVDRSIESAGDFIATNVEGTRVLLDAARKHQIKRFLHISTDEVYGSVPEGSVTEDAPLKPNSPYAASKAAADLLIRSYRETYGYPIMIARSTNNYGPYQYPEKVIPLFITNLLENKKMPLYSRGENRRDWIFVEDNVRALELILERGEEGRIYNVGGGNDTANIDLARLIARLMGSDEKSIQNVADRPGHDLRYSVDWSRVRALGFQPQTSLEDGLHKTIEWYRSHPAWWQPLKKDKFTLK